MEENSRKKSNLSHDLVPESESRISMNTEGRSESITDDADAAQPSRGHKRRVVDDEPSSAESVKPKRMKHTNTIILDNKVLRDCTVVVKADTIDNLTSDRKVLPIICSKEEDQLRGEKRKPDHYAAQSIKKPKTTTKYEPTTEYKRKILHTEVQITSNVNDQSDVTTTCQPKQDNQCNECTNSCVCKVGPSPLPRPTVRHGYPQLTPLYKKLLQRRLLNTVNVVFNKCCARQCSQVWCRGRFSRAHLEAGYGPSDLRVDIYKWGQWKQKAGEEKNDTDDDWFW